MIDTVIFDIGNVLAAFRWKDYIEELGMEGEIAERVANATVKSPEWNEIDRGVWTLEEVINGCVANDPELEKEIRFFFEDRRRLVLPYDYSAELLKDLQKKGYRVLLLSNFGEGHFTYIKENFEFFKYTDGMVISYEIKHIKPDPYIYEEIIRKYSLTPEKCVFLDDSAANIEGAVKAGMKGIHFTDAKKCIDELYNMLGEENTIL